MTEIEGITKDFARLEAKMVKRPILREAFGDQINDVKKKVDQIVDDCKSAYEDDLDVDEGEYADAVMGHAHLLATIESMMDHFMARGRR